MTRSLIAASVLVAAMSALGQAQPAGERMQPAGRQGGMHDMQTPKTSAEMKQSCEKAMQDMQAMKSECERADQQLEQQVQKLKQAQGDQKIDAIASTVEMMAQQRKQERERASEFMPKMMQHMQIHAAMAAQNPEQGQQAMSMCPMMQASGESARPAGQTLP